MGMGNVACRTETVYDVFRGGTGSESRLENKLSLFFLNFVLPSEKCSSS